MKNQDEIQNELREIAPNLAMLEKINIYQAPEGYFTWFTQQMVTRVGLGEVREELKVLAPEIAKLNKEQNAATPANYFTDFSSGLLSKIKAQEVQNELATIAPRLAALKKVNVLSVPVNYFESLPANILSKVHAQRQPEPVALPAWLESVNGVLEKIGAAIFKPKYSFAFSGFATMLIVGVMVVSHFGQCNDIDCKLAQLSNDEISSYLNHGSDAYSDEVFELNLEDKSIPASAETIVHPYKDALQNVSDAELKEALEE